MGACISLFLLSPTAVLAMNYTARDRCGEALALWAVLVNCFCLLLVPRLSLPTAVLPFSWDCRRARVLWTSFLCSCRAHHLSSKSSGTGCSLSMSPWCKREKVALINNFLGLRLLRLPSSPRHCSPLLQTLEEEVLGQRSAAETSWALYLQDLGRAFRLSCCWMQMLRFGISWWGSRCDTLVPLFTEHSGGLDSASVNLFPSVNAVRKEKAVAYPCIWAATARHSRGAGASPLYPNGVSEDLLLLRVRCCLLLGLGGLSRSC